jgi:hypothetical protein
MKDRDLDKMIAESLAVEVQDAHQAGCLGFISRAMTLATLPHRSVAGNEFTRTNGNYTLSIISPSAIGLPFGNIPRLLMSWVTTEAVRIKSPELELGPSLSYFMRELGLMPTGGRWGSITRLRDQMTRLFASSVTCIYQDHQRTSIFGIKMISEANLWWNLQSPDQVPLWKSTLRLGEDFYKEIINHPIPVDMLALKTLKRSPMALDIYCWLTYRMFCLQKPVEIPWPALQMQFGADYHRLIDFKINFIKQLKLVLTVYPEARVKDGENGLLLKPSKPHIAQKSTILVGSAAKRQHAPTPSPFVETPVAEPQALPLFSPVSLGLSKPAVAPIVESSVIQMAHETYEKAKRAAPGWDVYSLEQEWREWITEKEKPKNPDSAFIGFCKQRYQKKGRP